jgi:hypothetical protein
MNTTTPFFDLPPAPCKVCHSQLQSDPTQIEPSKRNEFFCSECNTRACVACGCTANSPCIKTVFNNDKTSIGTYACTWTDFGPCSFCLSKLAYQFYIGATAAAENSDAMLIFCNRCQRETEHTHMHDTAHGIPETHMDGSERYECSICENGIYPTEGKERGLTFVLD